MAAPGFHRLRLELRSGLGTPLAADTLWGHVAWGYRYRHGEAALVRWLEAHESPEPPLVISDPMPAGFLPRPALPGKARGERRPSPAEVDARRRSLRSRWIPESAWPGIAGRLDAASVESALAPPEAIDEGEDHSFLHASVNRLTGGTIQDGVGTLFTETRRTYAGPVALDVWIRSSLPADEIVGLFRDGLSGGYGRDAATGSGHLVVHEIQPAPFREVPGANAVVLLGVALPTRRDPARGFFRWSIRAGRLGGDFATGATPSGSTVRQKRPAVCLMAGTVLANGTPDWVGSVRRGIHEDPAIRAYGLSPVLPVRLLDPCLAEVA
jgi:CRISPR-associated protein Csm4